MINKFLVVFSSLMLISSVIFTSTSFAQESNVTNETDINTKMISSVEKESLLLYEDELEEFTEFPLVETDRLFETDGSNSLIGTTSIVGGGGSSIYQTVKISPLKTVYTNPERFPVELALAMVGVGAAFNLVKLPKTLDRFLAVMGLNLTLVSLNTAQTTYTVQMYSYFLKKPTSTSAGYYQLRIVNKRTGAAHFTKGFNIGKNSY